MPVVSLNKIENKIGVAFMAKLLLLAGLFMLLQLAYGLKAGAAARSTNLLPNPSDFSTGGNVYLVLSQGSLPTPDLKFIVVSGSPSGTLTIEDAKGCVGSPDYGSSNASFKVLSTTFSSSAGHRPSRSLTSRSTDSIGCRASLSLSYSGATASTAPGYEGKYVVIVAATRTNGASNAVNGFKVRAAGGVELGYAAGSDFSIQDRKSPLDSHSNFSFGFRPACSSRTGASTVRWVDADYGTIQTNHSTTLTSTGGGSWSKSGSALGGNGANAGGSLSYTSNSAHRYNWAWNSIHRKNGVQFRMPYESTGAYRDCVPPQDPATCSSTTPSAAWNRQRNRYTVNVANPNTTTLEMQYIRFRLDGGAWQGIDPASLTNRQTRTFSSWELNMRQGAHTVEWEIRTVDQSRFCHSTFTSYATPTCTAESAAAWVGQQFDVKASIRNTAPIGLTVNSSNYNVAGRSGSAGGADVGARATRGYTGRATVTTAGKHSVRWTFSTVAGVITCSGTDITTYSKPICTAESAAAWVGQQFDVKASIRNTAPIGLTVNSSNYNVAGRSGSAGGADVGARATQGYTGRATVTTAGKHSVRWTFSTVAGVITCSNDASGRNTEITIYSPPECTAEDIIAWSGSTISTPLSATIQTNITPIELVVNSAKYSVASGSSGSVANPGNVAAGGSRKYDGNATTAATGDRQITWTFGTVAGNIVCYATARVYDPPTCTVVINKASFKAGENESNISSVNVKSNYPNRTDIRSTELTVQDANTVNGTTGDINGAVTRTFSQSGNIRTTKPGRKDVTWVVYWEAETSGRQSINCASLANAGGGGGVSSTIVPLECRVTVNQIDTSGTSRPRIVIYNPNFIPVAVTSTQWSSNAGPALNPNAGPGTNGIAARGESSFESNSTVTAVSAGDFAITWTVLTEYGGASPYGANPATAGCINTLIVRSSPYVRFYGNDVIAGGGFGKSCSSKTVNVLADGVFKNGNTTGDYVGAAAELAVFATGSISGVHPGAMNSGRGLTEMSYANTVTGKPSNHTTPLFGGGYGGILCAPEFKTKQAGKSYKEIGNFVDLGTLESGEYVFDDQAGLHVGNLRGETMTIKKGARITIYVPQNFTILGNIVYEDSGSWTSIEDIPLLRIYASGDIRIDGNVTEIAGMFNSEKVIRTCSFYSRELDANSSMDTRIANRCNKKLTINGAFIAQEVQLLRVNGTLGNGSTNEGQDHPNIAETFRFSPELYLALIAEGKGVVNKEIESVINLPPAF